MKPQIAAAALPLRDEDRDARSRKIPIPLSFGHHSRSIAIGSFGCPSVCSSVPLASIIVPLVRSAFHLNFAGSLIRICDRNRNRIHIQGLIPIPIAIPPASHRLGVHPSPAAPGPPLCHRGNTPTIPTASQEVGGVSSATSKLICNSRLLLLRNRLCLLVVAVGGCRWQRITLLRRRQPHYFIRQNESTT